MALHDLQLCQQLIRDGRWRPATHDCSRDIRSLGLTVKRAGELLLELRAQDFKSEYGVCASNWGTVEADDYRFWLDTDTQNRCGAGEGTKVYIKLGIKTTSEGELCLVVSFHGPEDYK